VSIERAITDMFPEARVDPGEDLDLRYTTRETLDLCKRLAGVSEFDLDVAADAESHHAHLYFDVQTNGLALPWFGRVWCNPPYSDVPSWVAKAWTEIRDASDAMTIAMLLPCNRTEQPWWQDLVEPYRDQPFAPRSFTTHFLPTRVKFGHPGNRDGVGVGSPPFGCVLLVWRRA
jgi:hypothetical protein